MDKEQLYLTAQNYVNTPGLPVIILGSGASMAHGIPGMLSLAEELKSIRVFSDEDQECWKQFAEMIEKFDLEATLLKVRLTDSVEKLVLERTWKYLSEADLNVFKHVILRNGNFPLVDLLRYFFKTSSNKSINIITTNYDRLAEYAASVSDLFPFTYFLSGYFSSFVGDHDDCFTKAKKCAGVANICKLHGSLDWFELEEPYPCYRSIPLQRDIPDKSSPCIVTPGTSKFQKTHQTPFRELFGIADSLIDNASSYLCIGYGFNDEHVHPRLLKNIAENKRPIVVLTKKLTPNTLKILDLDGADKLLLIEDNDTGGSKIYSKQFKVGVDFDDPFWQLNSFLKIIN